MLILERSITKHYWMKMYRYLYRKIQRGHYERVGSSGVLRFRCGKECLAYAITVKHNGDLRPIAWLYLWQKPNWRAWEVMHVFVFEKLRGRGLAKRLYQAAINLDGLIMASGKSQSKTSRALWSGFVKNKTFDIYAIDYWDMKQRSQVFWDDEFDEIYCDLTLWTKVQEQDSDVRMIATRRKR